MRRSVSSVQANDVVILIFDPDAAQEAALACSLFRCDIKHQATYIAKKLAAYVMKVIVLAVEVAAIRIHHPGEAHGLVLHLEQLLEAAHQARLHALILLLQIILAVDRLAHIHAAQKIMVGARNWAELRISRQILQVSLDHRRAVREHLHEPMLALNEAIDHLVHGSRRSERR